jgi:hypothetical protein
MVSLGFMDPADIAFIKGALAFVLLAGTGLSAYWIRLKGRHLAATRGEDLFEAQREENARLRAEVDARVAELEERVDFVERRLIQEHERPRLPGPPQVRTPL